MKITIGCDHRGFSVKKKIMDFVKGLGHEIEDCGAFSGEFSDYPDFAFAASEYVGSRKSDRGILICGTSIGMCMSANKVAGVRAASCHDMVTAEMSRRHNDANVLCLSADLLGEEMMERLIRVWLETEFEGGRHARRVDKIMKYEADHRGR